MGYIESDELITLIKDHKEKVKSGNPYTDDIYGMAHDQIIEIVRMLDEYQRKREIIAKQIARDLYERL